LNTIIILRYFQSAVAVAVCVISICTSYIFSYVNILSRMSKILPDLSETFQRGRIFNVRA
jgi:hypothetical protein